MTLLYCATCFSVRLEQLPSAVGLLITPLSVHQLPLTVTLFLTLTINPNRTSNALPIPCANEPSVRRFTLEGAVGPLRTETTNSSSIRFQSLPNTREIPLATMWNITSKVSNLEKIFANEKATYTSITAGIHSQSFFM